jgi:hypothetical protein
MKAILEFDLPKDHEEFNVMSKGVDLYLTLWDLDQYLRNKIKHNSDNLSEEVLEAFDEVRDVIRDILNNHSCSLEMMS